MVRLLLDVNRPPPTHTHTVESKEKGKQHSRMQGKWSKVKNFPSEERKQSKNHCSPVILERKKHEKKVKASQDGSAGAIKSFIQKEPRPV